ncbi:GDSL-type esterase/lipase family protein [Luteimonas fraxinea]|uniref:GDSL-type esterase/lipase family protein n=1 Tax=Luteimonas fraxinea TaxID=2901869 RepID=A0ABS8U696_9GAMM|nr:GDSL-type esterase/lipase family protein [Luteimonas fraxinea]MCD9095331.1 GDSL-type esterase/lipase family protein [Luteimonas fraxinea]UHH11454.1 GDSL-type esterase/lipase family protein [Luteimonas fraxinea]
MTAPRRYLALGDSYTIGEGIAAEDRWPVQLADALRNEGIALDAPEVIATTGWTTDELDAAIDAAAPVGPFDLVSLLIGVNDQYRGRDVALYGPAFSALLDRATGFAGGDAARVFVLAIPDWGVTPFGAHSGRDVAAIARELDAYNAAAAAICAAHGVAFVDIAAVSRAQGGEAEMLADDGLHPLAALHTEWMQLALPVARGLLSRA